MEDNAQKKNKFQQFYSQLRTNFFNIMFELLKEKNTSIFLGCFIILIVFIQLIGLLFEPEKFSWRDQFFLNYVIQICNYCRVLKAINEAQSLFFYWALMFFGIFYLITMTVLLIYMNYFLKNRKHYVEHVVKILRIMILLLYWIFYMPFFESFISIFNCQNGSHYLDTSLTCYSGIHIFYIVLCIIFLILLFVNNIIIAMLYNETQPVQEDCLSRLESSFEMALVIYRSIVSTFSNFCASQVCSWILIAIYLISSCMLCYQYYKQIPYYNQFVSIFCGSLIYIYFWISVNALLMMLVEVNGHIVIIFVGVPIITILVINLRDKRIESLMKTNIEKLKVDNESLIQVHNMTDFSRGLQQDQTQRMTMIGIVNLHIDECQNADCPCKEENELYDVQSNSFSERNRQAPHLDEVFLNHFIKKLYEDALNKFVNSPSIHIAFAFYLFKVMKNIHASLVELNIAIKKKPSLQQQFTIFRYKNIIEEYIIQDHADHKAVYPELTNVIEFERLFGEMQKSIEKVCNLQVEFWTHLTTVVPDLNILNDLGKKIYTAAEETDSFWVQLSKINSNYSIALSIYGEYLREIRNHEHLGNTYIERSNNSSNGKKSVDEHAKTSDILFSQDTTVLHISGNKDSLGKILKTSQGLQQVFGYTKTEVIGHSVNILMPTLFAKKHGDFLERFFKTGRQVIFYMERGLFATHRNGNCFQMKILVKQMPSLQEGIQYVGMIKPVTADYEYMLTDMDGVIDSFTKGLTSLLGLTPNLFKDKDSQINIQILAPELVPFFLETQEQGKPAKSRFREQGGDYITLIVPQNFHQIAKSESKQNSRGGARTKGNRSVAQSHNARGRSTVFKQFLKMLSKPKRLQRDKMPSVKDLLKQPEYVNCERKKEVQCEITGLQFKVSVHDTLKLLIFKFSKNEKSEKKKTDDLGNYLEDYRAQSKQGMGPNEYEDFKQISQMDESQENASVLQDASHKDMRYVDREINKKNPGESSRKVNFQDDKSQVEPTLKGQSTHRSVKSIQQQENSKQASSVNTPKNQASGTSQGVNGPSKESQNLAFMQKFTLNNQEPARADSVQEYQSQSQKKSGQQAQSELNQAIEEEQDKDDSADLSQLETPKMDVSGIKLESAQKEKNSFFEELKKQSFILSEGSTIRMQVKDSLNIGANQKKEKNSFQQEQQNIIQNGTQRSSLALDADKMVKKQNENNMNRQFKGDDWEPQETIPEDQSKDNESQEEDDSESQEQENQSRSKTKSNKQKSQQSDEAHDSEELEDDYDESKDDDQSDKDGSSSEDRQKTGSKKSQQEGMDQRPFLSGRQPYMNNQSSSHAVQNNQKSKNSGYDYQDQIQNQSQGRTSEMRKSQNQLKYQIEDMYTQDQANRQSFKKMQIKKRDTFKIRTNLKYKCVDDGSEDENMNQKNNVNDDQQLSSKELQFREGVLKFERRKKRKEKKQRDKELKKMKALNDESNSSLHSADEVGRDSTAGPGDVADGDDDEEPSESSSSSSEEEKQDGKNKGQQNGLKKKQKADKKSLNNDEGEISSVTTRQNKTERYHYILRMAIDEKYIPNSISNIGYAAYLIFIILSLLAIIYYVIQISLFNKMSQNITNLHNSESRLNYVIDITLRTRSLILINEGKLNFDSIEAQYQFGNITTKELRKSAQNLKDAQADLSLQASSLPADQLEKINPNNVLLQYLNSPGMPDSYTFSVWEAIMELVVSAFRISTMPIEEISNDNPTAYFIYTNNLNSVLQALNQSTDAILNQSGQSVNYNISIFLYLLISVSCALFVSLLFVIPVISRVTRSKQEVLKLFTLKNIEKHIDEQLKVCRNFISTKLQQNQDQEQQDMDGEDANANMNEKELQNELNNNKYLKRIKKKNKGKKMKELSTNFGATMLKFLLFLSIIEGYFLANYLLSSQFLNGVQSLTVELNLLIQRQPVQSFLLLIQKELIYTNGTESIEGKNSMVYVPAYQNMQYSQEEQLLDIFSLNYDSHTSSYNDDFNNIIYSDVCKYGPFDVNEQSVCEGFDQGILKKGIYSSVIKYWDYLRQLNHDFLESNRNSTMVIDFLNDERLQTCERMQDFYFKKSLNLLVSKLEDDIQYFFNVEYIQNRTIFIIYIIYIAILYFFIWRKFVRTMQNELWKTKTMLSVLPTKVCFEVKEIREVIQKNSSNDFISTKL